MKEENKLKNIVFEKLNNLELNDAFDINEFLTKYWRKCDCFARRSFDVLLCNTKKQFLTGKKFKTAKGKIIRVE